MVPAAIVILVVGAVLGVKFMFTAHENRALRKRIEKLENILGR